jgi:hypothetical protein
MLVVQGACVCATEVFPNKLDASPTFTCRIAVKEYADSLCQSTLWHVCMPHCRRDIELLQIVTAGAGSDAWCFGIHEPYESSALSSLSSPASDFDSGCKFLVTLPGSLSTIGFVTPTGIVFAEVVSSTKCWAHCCTNRM